MPYQKLRARVRVTSSQYRTAVAAFISSPPRRPDFVGSPTSQGDTQLPRCARCCYSPWTPWGPSPQHLAEFELQPLGEHLRRPSGRAAGPRRGRLQHRPPLRVERTAAEADVLL